MILHKRGGMQQSELLSFHFTLRRASNIIGAWERYNLVRIPDTFRLVYDLLDHVDEITILRSNALYIVHDLAFAKLELFHWHSSRKASPPTSCSEPSAGDITKLLGQCETQHQHVSNVAFRMRRCIQEMNEVIEQTSRYYEDKGVNEGEWLVLWPGLAHPDGERLREADGGGLDIGRDVSVQVDADGGSGGGTDEVTEVPRTVTNTQRRKLRSQSGHLQIKCVEVIDISDDSE